MSEVRRIEPSLSPPPTFDIIGLDFETALALRTILYYARGKGHIPGLSALHQQLQDTVVGTAIVIVNHGNDFDLTRRAE
jgi:hypothetical protein